MTQASLFEACLSVVSQMFLLAFLQYVYVCSTAALQHERSMVFADLAIPPEEERWPVGPGI